MAVKEDNLVVLYTQGYPLEEDLFLNIHSHSVSDHSMHQIFMCTKSCNGTWMIKYDFVELGGCVWGYWNWHNLNGVVESWI